jgi:hypothetical protein
MLSSDNIVEYKMELVRSDNLKTELVLMKGFAYGWIK